MPFLKTTGGKGLHVVVPIARRQGWDRGAALLRGVRAADGGQRRRSRFTANMAKAQRRGRIYLDYLRNVAQAPPRSRAYSLRARPGVPASTPLAWDELAPARRPGRSELRYRAGAAGADGRVDPWAGIDQSARALTKDIERKLQNRA